MKDSRQGLNVVEQTTSQVDAFSKTTQSTLAAGFSRSGIGLHSGTSAQVWVLPAEPGQGRYFVRLDLPDAPPIRANGASVNPTVLSTELGCGNARVRTVEHLLAALLALGVDNARIEIDGAELPLLDGSAQEWATAIAQVGIVPQAASRSSFALPDPIWIREDDAFVAAIPATAIRFTYGIDFELSAIGNQWHSWSPGQTAFATEIAPARTFGFAHQVEQLRASGLIKGGSLENALVCSAEGWVNPPLRFPNEPVRHKLLDLIGDLSLLGTLPSAHFLAYKASHRLHTQLVRHILAIRPS
ncbi:UDP-3-O-acyl-N-acetylglucosamine deacetylase [Myxacorys almedinensis]|uniref:UDP-3-O-acyl-N-acetylglucosamine deacetylase n=1 Tax=Myxacorys almedinensis A TaxID=2690445 RepID=A0A8J7YW24_9CYAN|nr:UDP-3-O-acyl-N-acetylglucosamine deacetylase [Myxacorys almedinensis]NDJ15732.1 UDP-3-O-acyl-N-acetylglucosamine deacetylase [Myxacorys almedinensis A]